MEKHHSAWPPRESSSKRVGVSKTAGPQLRAFLWEGAFILQRSKVRSCSECISSVLLINVKELQLGLPCEYP